MKAIFTYPNNAATSYIDPLYVGDGSDGFQKRIQDLKDGNYLSWTGTAPVDTVSDLMSNISKFNDYYWDRGEFHHISIHDLYTYPLLIGTKELIEADVATTTVTLPIEFDLIGHTFLQGERVLATQFVDSMSSINNNQYYVKVIDSDTIQLSLNSGLTQLLEYAVQHIDVATATAADPCVFTSANFTHSHDDLTTMSGFDGSLSEMNGQEVYVQAIDNDTFKLSYSIGPATDKIAFQAVQVDVPISNVIVINGSDVKLDLTSMFDAPVKRAKVNITAGSLGLNSIDFGTPGNGKIKSISDDGSKIVTSNYAGWIYEYNKLTNSWARDFGMVPCDALSGDGAFAFTLSNGYNVATGATIGSVDQIPGTEHYSLPVVKSTYDGDRIVTWKRASYSNLGVVVVQRYSAFYNGWKIEQTIGNGEWFMDMSGDGNKILLQDKNTYELIVYTKPAGYGSWSAMPTLTYPPIDRTYVMNQQLYTIYPSLSNDGHSIVIPGTNGMLVYTYVGADSQGNPAHYAYSSDASLGYGFYGAKINADGTRIKAITTTSTIIDIKLENGVWNEIDSIPFPDQPYERTIEINADDSITSCLGVAVGQSPGPTASYLSRVFHSTVADDISNYILNNYGNAYTLRTPDDNFELYSDRFLTTKVDITPLGLPDASYNPQNNQYDIGDTLVDSTTGVITEIVSTVDPWIIQDPNPQVTNAGHLTISTSETNRYRLGGLNLSIPGNADYGYLNTSGVRVPGAEVNYTMARDAGGTPSVIGLQPDITIATDSIGHVTGATIVTNGTFPTDGELVFPLQELPDQYVPPAPNTAAMEDYFDTNDGWTDLSGYQGAGKMFGKDIIPTTASITYVQPSTTNMSQNGRKYVRSSGFVKTKLEVNYTNLTKAEFQELHADAQAARGQAATFYLVVSKWGGKVLNFNTNASRSNPRLVTPYAAGETLLKLGGFNSNEQDVFKKGEMIIGNGGNENGDLLTVLNTVDANVYGEAKIRVAYGNPYSAINGTKIYKNPYWIVVSLDSDEFQYTVDTFGLYNVTVTFETGSYS